MRTRFGPLGHLGPISEDVPYAHGAINVPCRRTTVRNDEAKEALRLITNVLNDPRLEPDDGHQLRKAQRDLMEMGRSGKLERRKLFRAVRIISQVLRKLL